jgi:hypothetical protein
MNHVRHGLGGSEPPRGLRKFTLQHLEASLPTLPRFRFDEAGVLYEDIRGGNGETLYTEAISYINFTDTEKAVLIALGLKSKLL